MDIIDFFSSSPLELPKERQTADFEHFLAQILSDFTNTIAQLSGGDPVTAGVHASLPVIQTLCQEIRAAVSHYFDGFPHGAYNHLTAGIQAVRPHLDRLASRPDIAPSLQCLYRVRLGNLSKFSRPALFHIPFELRHRVTSKRYSISGLPSLYLGGSLWVCWEECGRPDFHKMHVSQFRPAAGATMQVLDFGYRPALTAAMVKANQGQIFGGGAWTDFVISQAVCWPLIAACSIKVLNSGDPDSPSPFIPEYIIPQLLLQWLRNETIWDGLRYFSTKISQYVRDPTVPMNYVFPVRVKAPTGHCATLRAKFVLSDPIAWSMLAQAGLPTTHLRNPTWDMELADGVGVTYLQTTFWDCESKLALFPCTSI
jgi:hypothetical protein